MTLDNDHTLDRLIRSHDPADTDTLELRSRLDARLAERPALPDPAPTAPRRSLRRRLIGLAAAAAAVSTAYVLLPGPGQGNAYASWTATPQAVADRDAAVAVEECRDAMRGPFWARQKGGPEEFDPAAAGVGLTERRGDLVSVLLRDEGPLKQLTANCVVALEEGAASGKVEGWGVGGSTGGPPVEADADGFYPGSMFQSGDREPLSMVDGSVGENVSGLTLHAGDLTVQATIEDGRYAAWFPGRIFPDRDWGPSGQGGPVPILTYDLTLTDGTVITDAEPSEPK